METHIIVKAPLNTAFQDKATFEPAMSETDAKKRCEALNKVLRQDADFRYKPRKL
ncbi:hypothetical protein [Alteromonas macleodii]|jgi:hypothetical protein|uniref:hypothetical protein n=1 Tax=Alteromonas macleodii TaxID=28108 RepID=UPI0024A8FE96|nr:hypothetical protein [Alteromonas macleodii]|tara:strand:- start:15614 stop:15778 length:165 start_codon:yes stop_codon:yes gene_type:complete